jgi:hypothetical protein
MGMHRWRVIQKDRKKQRLTKIPVGKKRKTERQMWLYKELNLRLFGKMLFEKMSLDQNCWHWVAILETSNDHLTI